MMKCFSCFPRATTNLPSSNKTNADLTFCKASIENTNLQRKTIVPSSPSQPKTNNKHPTCPFANQKLGRPLAAVVAKCCVRSKAQRISSQLSTSSWSFWKVTNWEPPKKSSTSPPGCIVEGEMRYLFFSSFTLNILKI